MPQPNNKNKHNDDNKEVKIREDKSSLAEFTKRPLPTEEEVEDFENFVGEEAREEAGKEYAEDYKNAEIKPCKTQKLLLTVKKIGLTISNL